MNALFQTARDFIQAHDQFLVVSHVHPDGDAASSTLAVGWMLTHLNKRFWMMNEGEIPDKFKFLKNSGQIASFASPEAKRTFRHVIAVDCADYSRIGQLRSLIADDAAILNIDHHPTNDRFGEVALVRDDAAATAEVLFDLIEWMDIPWHTDLAECIYTGLLTDTGGFRYSNTSSKVLLIASRLVGLGVNGSRLADALLETMSYRQVMMLKTALSGLAFDERRQIGWFVISQEQSEQFQARDEDFEGLVNYPQNIEGVEVGLMFREMGARKVKVSFRSSGLVDVAQIAKSLGGGGHVRAAGCTLETTLEQAVSQVVPKIRAALP